MSDDVYQLGQALRGLLPTDIQPGHQFELMVLIKVAADGSLTLERRTYDPTLHGRTHT